MSNPMSLGGALPSEPPELAAERERLMAELLKQAKTATGPTQTVLRKLHEVLSQLRPGAPANPQVYTEAKVAFEQFGKAAVGAPPPVLMQTIEFMQKRATALAAAGPAQPPKSAPPPPPAQGGARAGASPAQFIPAGAPPRSGPPRRGTVDGFEMPKRTQSSVSLNPATPGVSPSGPGQKPGPGAPPPQPKSGSGKG